jgi:hypothetical protein
MASQLTYSQHLISIGEITLAGLGLDTAASQVSHLGCLVARAALKMLPSLVLAAWQTSQTFAFDHPRLLECLSQLLSLWPVVVSLAKAL